MQWSRPAGWLPCGAVSSARSGVTPGRRPGSEPRYAPRRDALTQRPLAHPPVPSPRPGAPVLPDRPIGPGRPDRGHRLCDPGVRLGLHAAVGDRGGRRWARLGLGLHGRDDQHDRGGRPHHRGFGGDVPPITRFRGQWGLAGRAVHAGCARRRLPGRHRGALDDRPRHGRCERTLGDARPGRPALAVRPRLVG